MRGCCSLATVSLGEDEKVLEVDDGDGCTMGRYLMPQNCTFLSGNFYVTYILPR